MSRRALVTGAASGIGAATFELFRQQGWEVIGIDRDWGERVPAGSFELDVSDEAGLRELVGRVGALDSLVNNAAVMPIAPLDGTDSGPLRRALEVNLVAAAVAVAAATEGLRQRRGSIVNVASVHAVATSGKVAGYAAAKGALLAHTRAVAIELGGYGVRVNAVIPGAVDTPMLAPQLSGEARAESLRALGRKTPLGRVATPEEIAEAIVFLADGQRSSFITGAGLVVDGGALARLSTE